jgi:hypothetical protein
MSTLADQLFQTAQSLQGVVQTLQLRGDPNSTADAALISQSVALFLMAATQENAHNASASLLADAGTVAAIQKITSTVNAESTRLASISGRAQLSSRSPRTS